VVNNILPIVGTFKTYHLIFQFLKFGVQGLFIAEALNLNNLLLINN